MKKFKFVVLTFVLVFSFSINSNSKTVPASFADLAERLMPVSYTHLTLPTTPYV